MKRYAQSTAVPISKSRGEIEKLLRVWGADAIQWSDNFTDGHVSLRFVWSGYVARFDVTLETEASIKGRCLNRWKEVVPGKLRQEMDRRGRQEHRVLLLWLKAALNAIEMGIVSPEALFLAFLEDKNGRTVSEVAIPKLGQLGLGSATKLLGAGQ